jgi:hypothetical protein
VSQFIDPDALGSASHRHLVDHLIGPLAAGAVTTGLDIDAAGIVRVDLAAREPLVVIAPLHSVERNELHVDAVLDPGGARTSLPTLRFAPHTEHGAFLALHQPRVDEGTRRAAPFALELAVRVIDTQGTGAPLAASEIAAMFEVRLVEGVLGRVLFALTAEKARMRRMARAIAAMRNLDDARDDALDRIGAELAVPRFSDRLAFADGTIVTQSQREPDAEYRRRIAIYRRFLFPTRERLVELLNGPGATTEPNRGALAELGVTGRFSVIEADDEFAVAITIVSASAPAERANFFAYLRAVHLVEPAVDVAPQRFLPTQMRAAQNALRARLRAAYTVAAGMHMAPALAHALDRLAALRAALGATTPVEILRAQSDDGGSRYQLGLGVDIVPIAVAELDALHAAATSDAITPGTALEIAALARAAKPRSSADDPDGGWLFEAVGLRTVHRVDTTRLYLSHFPTFGLAIVAPTELVPGTPTPFEAHYHAPGDPGSNAALSAAVAAATAQWAAEGRPAWTELDDTTAHAEWVQAVAFEPTVANVLRAAELPVASDVPQAVAALGRLPDELHATLRLDAGLAARVRNGDAGAIDELRRLRVVLTEHHLVSALPLVTTSDLLIVVSVIGLPAAGVNLSDRRATGFRWYAVPLQGEGTEVGALGSRTFVTAKSPGVFAIVALGYARRGLTDPYEFRVDLPSEASIGLLAYEWLMNALDHAHAVGVEINTFAIRTSHVDVDGDGDVERLPPSLARTFRPFRWRRHRGEAPPSDE